MSNKSKKNSRRKPLTVLQRNVFEIIKSHLANNGKSPTFDEISNELGNTGRGSVRSILVALHKRGLVTWGHRAKRSLVICGEPEKPKATNGAANVIKTQAKDIKPSSFNPDIIEQLVNREAELNVELNDIRAAIQTIERFCLKGLKT